MKKIKDSLIIVLCCIGVTLMCGLESGLLFRAF